MSEKFQLLTGPAGSGKTRSLLASYRAAQCDSPFASTLWIAPNQLTANSIRETLVLSGLRGCFEPGVTTFDQFAEKTLDASKANVRSVSPSQQRLLIQTLLHDANQKGQLPYFSAIAETDGFLDLVIELIRELKRLEIWPEEYAAACRRQGHGARDRELIAIYESYQAILNQHRLYDSQGRFWSARTSLSQEEQFESTRFDLLVVDGFTDFTRPQHDILATLASRAEQTLISLPLEIDSSREDLFSKTTHTLRELTERHPNIVIQQLDRNPTRPGAFAHVEQELFKNPRDVVPYSEQTPSSPTGGSKTSESQPTEIVAASGKLGEFESVAHRIKQLLLEENVRPSEIAVVLRSSGESAPLLREVFERFGIPTAFEFHESLSAAPALRALVSVLRLDLEDWPFRLLLDVIGNQYLRPPQFVHPMQDAAPSSSFQAMAQAAERFVRQMQIPSGREAVLREIEYWAKNTQGASKSKREENPPEEQQEQEPSSRRARVATISAPLFRALAHGFDSLPKKASLSEWAEAILSLAESLGLSSLEPREPIVSTRSIANQPRNTQTETDSERLDRFDRLGWKRLGELFESAHHVAQWNDTGADQKLTRPELVATLSDWLRTEPLGESRDSTGKVRILSAQSARNLSIDYLFLAGLSEKSFPASEREDRLISEADVLRLAEGGLPLVDRRARLRDEMLLFYEVVTRPRKRLTLSYPALDDKAQPLLPSPYLLEIDRLFPPGTIQRTDATNLSPIPLGANSFSLRDFRVRAVATSLSGDSTLLASLIPARSSAMETQHHHAAAPDTALPRSSSFLSAALSTVAERRKADQFGPHEGILLSDSAHRVLADRFGAQHLWSPSRLEQFAMCPYQFFLERVLNIQPLDELSLETNFLRRGRMLHDTLATIHEKLNQAETEDASLGPLGAEMFVAQFQAIVAELMESETHFGDVALALAELDRREVSSWAGRYFDQSLKYEKSWNELDEPLRPAHFEVRFGPAQQEEEQPIDPLSTDEPFALDLGGESILLTGRIDRIDLGASGEQPVFNVIDYKSGKRAALKIEAIQTGLALQLPLYSMAAESMLLSHQDAAPWQAGYWTLQGTGYSVKQSLTMSTLEEEQVQRSPAWLELQSTVKHRIKEMIHSMRGGEFPVFSQNEDCTSACAFRTVCRVNQIRSLGKQWPPSAEEEGL